MIFKCAYRDCSVLCYVIYTYPMITLVRYLIKAYTLKICLYLILIFALRITLQYYAKLNCMCFVSKNTTTGNSLHTKPGEKKNPQHSALIEIRFLLSNIPCIPTSLIMFVKNNAIAAGNDKKIS